jgi:exonuclease SbcC
MRPLRLVLDGFGSYRDHTDIDLTDVGFFVLTGPTGAGKSTVIDGLCFALYGTAPRWGREKGIRNALAPSVNWCRVCLVFEAAGERYAAARVLRRDARGQVHTKEARLDRLNPAVPPDAELSEVLGTGPVPLAEGPDQVTAEITDLLGIGYEHFTQCVLLPQGRFAEFLHAKPEARQNLLVELLSYAVYERVGQRARERAVQAGIRLAAAERELDLLGEVGESDLDAAAAQVGRLDALVPTLDNLITQLAELRAEATRLQTPAVQARDQAAQLAALRMPPDVPELAARLRSADELLASRTEIGRAHV